VNLRAVERTIIPFISLIPLVPLIPLIPLLFHSWKSQGELSGFTKFRAATTTNTAANTFVATIFQINRHGAVLLTAITIVTG
jgi:hypothetical protein